MKEIRPIWQGITDKSDSLFSDTCGGFLNQRWQTPSSEIVGEPEWRERLLGPDGRTGNWKFFVDGNRVVAEAIEHSLSGENKKLFKDVKREISNAASWLSAEFSGNDTVEEDGVLRAATDAEANAFTIKIAWAGLVVTDDSPYVAAGERLREFAEEVLRVADLFEGPGDINDE